MNKLKFLIKIDSKLLNHISNLLNLKILIIMVPKLYIFNLNKMILFLKKFYQLYKILIKLILVLNIKIVLIFLLNLNNLKLYKQNKSVNKLKLINHNNQNHYY